MNHATLYNIQSNIQSNVTFQITNNVIYEGNFGQVLIGYIKDDEIVNIHKNQDTINPDITYYAFKIYDKLKLKKIKFATYNDFNEIVYVNGIVKFKQEGLILSKLRHKNIIQYIEFIENFYDEDSDENISALVTSYVSNRSLMTYNTTTMKYIINSAVLPLHGYIYHTILSTSQQYTDNYFDDRTYWCTLIFGYLVDIAVAVSYMHSKSISHRDIKPENLLLSQHNHIIVCDFGSAEDYSSSVHLTRNNQHPIDFVSNTAGTMCFWAPECVAPERFASKTFEDLDCTNESVSNTTNDIINDVIVKSNNVPPCYEYSAYKLDHWSVGIVLYCLIFGNIPFLPPPPITPPEHLYSHHSPSPRPYPSPSSSNYQHSSNGGGAMELFDMIANTEPIYDLSIDSLFPHIHTNNNIANITTSRNILVLNDDHSSSTICSQSFFRNLQYEVKIQDLIIIMKGLLQKQLELRLSMQDILTYKSHMSVDNSI